MNGGVTREIGWGTRRTRLERGDWKWESRTKWTRQIRTQRQRVHVCVIVLLFVCDARSPPLSLVCACVGRRRADRWPLAGTRTRHPVARERQQQTNGHQPACNHLVVRVSHTHPLRAHPAGSLPRRPTDRPVESMTAGRCRWSADARRAQTRRSTVDTDAH